MERVQSVSQPANILYRFFADPHNLPLLTPARLRFEFVTPPPEELRAGTMLNYRIHLYGMPIDWTTRIELVEPPYCFIDVQERGPYALWRNTHIFRERGGHKTTIIDHVEYAMPFGPLGEIAWRLFVARNLKQLYDFREAQLPRALALSSSFAD